MRALALCLLLTGCSGVLEGGGQAGNNAAGSDTGPLADSGLADLGPQADGDPQGGPPDAGVPDQGGPPDPGVPDQGGPVDPCAGKQCLSPPAPTCISSTTLRTYAKPGTCTGGSCSYPSSDATCANGCSGGKCAAPCSSALDCATGWCQGGVCCKPGTAGCSQAKLSLAPTPWPAPAGSYYRYAPTAVEENGYRYTFWCANLTSGVVTDHIIMRRDQWNGSGWTVGSEKVALAPGSPGSWDDRHVCDPDVVRGEFYYKAPGASSATKYTYALFYLGVDDEQANGGVNQVGWAVANDLQGPWKRVSVTKPLVSATQWWGAGQPAVTSINGKGDVLLFYTRGDASGTRTLRRKASLFDANAPVLGAEKALPTAGLTKASGSPDPSNHGGALVYDIGRDLFWLVRAGHPFPTSCPGFVSDQLQVASIPGSSVWNATGSWTVHANITGAVTGSARVFDGGFAKNPYGNLLLPDRLDLVVSVSKACVSNNFATALWSYRSHGVTLQL